MSGRLSLDEALDKVSHEVTEIMRSAGWRQHDANVAGDAAAKAVEKSRSNR